MIYSPIIIVGSGPSGATVAFSLIEEKCKVLLIDQGYNKETKFDKNNTNAKVFHPKLENKEYQFVLHDFIKKNKIIQSNFSATGSLAIGGLSNVWGGGYWNYFNKIHHKSFEKFLENNFDILNFDDQNSKNLANYFNENNDLSFYKSAQLLSLKNKKEIYNSAEIIKKLKNSDYFEYKNNIFIKEIIQEDDSFILIDDNQNKFKCKKLILACGTIGSTKLVMKLNKIINIKQNLLHNISYGFLGKLKKKHNYDQTKKHTPGSIFIYDDKELKRTISGSIGRYSDELGCLINQKIIFPFNIIIKNFIKMVKSHVVFGKIFLPAEFSNTKIFLDTDDTLKIIGSKNLELIKEEDKLIKKFFFSNKNIFKKIYNKELPLGSDSHYTSTMSTASLIENLKTNDYGELITRKNLFIVDASIIGAQGSQFPTFEIMNNAYRIGKFIAKEA